MTTYSQDLIFTVLPFGMSGSGTQTYVDFSVIISPRLMSTSPALTNILNYPDWCTGNASTDTNWADAIAAFIGTPDPTTGVVPHLQLSFGGVKHPMTLLSTLPTRAHVQGVFAANTKVLPYVYQGMDTRKIRSAPVGTIADTIERLYGAMGLTYSHVYPTWANLVHAADFGALGFEQQPPPPSAARGLPDPGIPGDGAARKQKLQNALEAKLASSKAIPYDLSAIAASIHPAIPGATTSLAFLQHQTFMRRNLPKVTSTFTQSPPDPTTIWDFHQMVAGLGSMPTLLRTLGLVLDFKAGPITMPTSATKHNVVLVTGTGAAAPPPFKITTQTVFPPTSTTVGAKVFKPAPHSTSTDHVNRMLKLGDSTLYRVIRLDHDNAAVKAMQFADAVTRSHHGGAKQTQSTPSRFAMPALKTGGFAIARSGRAVQMAATLAYQTQQLQDTYFGSGSPPPLTEDDLTRGYRFDVLNHTDGKWRSLMWRQGPVTVGTDTFPVIEEDTVVPAPTTATRNPNDPKDLYLQETLTRWDGWSLAVPRVGSAMQGTSVGTTNDTGGSSGFGVTTAWHVPGSYRTEVPEGNAGGVNVVRLPRLRFGDTYQLRARAVDLAGNSLSVASAPKSGIAVSPPLKHLRFEPIPAPRLYFVDAPLSGASEEVIVIRSESAQVDGIAPAAGIDNGTTFRLVAPAPTSVFMAEQHGALDAPAGQTPTSQAPMDNSIARYTELAQRDGYRLELDPIATLAHGGAHGTDNPYLISGGFFPINYLPEFIGREALVRGLPANAFKKTTAILPFNTGGATWPTFEAARIRLSRGNAPWTTHVVTDPNTSAKVTELDIQLPKGVTLTTLVNSGITPAEINLMAVWEWIQQTAIAQHKSTATVLAEIKAGQHWMFTPWRTVKFVHAVRTPLLVPVLYLQPKKVAGHTYATFTGTKTKPLGGTVKMSRKSTARIDVDATWKMPIDTGINPNPTQLQTFTGHAFTLEVARTGHGYLPAAHGPLSTVDAINFNQKHEFNDTKYRAVTYQGTATSFYTEYFRQEIPGHFLPLGAHPIAALKAAPVPPGVAFEGSTIKLTQEWTENPGTPTAKFQSRPLVPAPPGTPLNTPAPTPGDFVVVEDPNLNTSPATATHGTVQMLANANVPEQVGAFVRCTYVGPTIHTFSNPTADKTTSSTMLVLNSARPKAPDVRYVVPIYRRSANSTSITRYGGGLRVYLERPWWSTGDKEELGVVCWHKGSSSAALPPNSLSPYVTAWGYDPIFKSTTSIAGQPTPKCFPLAVSTSSSGSLTIDETTSKVDVAGHRVSFDAVRGLWYCDIQVSDSNGKEIKSYSPFIRFSFARYQPHSVAGCHLSKVVTVDFAQLAPNRHVTMSGSGNSRKITITGRAPTGTVASSKPSLMYAIVEQHDARIPDDTLAWSRAQAGPGLPFFNPVFSLTPSISDKDYVTWTGHVSMPQANLRSMRVTFEEHERISGGAGDGRLVWTDSLPLVTVPGG